VINFNNGDVTLTHTSNTVTVAGGTLATAALTASTGTFSGVLKTDDATEATSTTDGSLQTDGGLSVVKDAVFGDDIKLLSDSAVIALGADGDTTLTHTDGTGLTLNSTNKLTFGDVASFVQQSSDGTLRIDGEQVIDLNASTRVDVSGDIKVGGEVQTASIGYTDGDNAMTIADGGGVTFPVSIDVTGSTGIILENDETITNSTNGEVAINGTVVIGTGSAAGTLKSSGNQDITIQTGNSTTGSITITDGANGDIAISPNGSGDINIPANIGLTFGDDGEKIEGDGTDLTIASSAKLNLSATSDVHVPKNVGIVFDDNASEKIESNNTDLTINSGADINLTATGDVNMPANVGITFGDDAEKIEGDGTDLTISGNNINLTATADVVIPANVGITFGSGEKIEGDSTDLTVTSGADINLTATSDINVPANVGITFGDDAEKIEGDGTDLTIAGNIINLTPADNVKLNGNTGIGVGANTVGTDFAVTGGGGDYNGTNIVSLQVGTSAGTATTRGFMLVQGTTDAGVIFGDSGNGSDKKKFGIVFQGETLDLGFIGDSAKGINTGTGALAISTSSNVTIPSGYLDMNNNAIHNVGHADNDWTSTALTVKGYIEQVATYEYQVIKVSGSDPHMFKVLDQKHSVAHNTSDDLFKITSIISQSTMFTGYVDYVVMSDYQETIEAGRFLITGGRRWASGNAVVQIEKVYSDTADARGGGETITVSLAGTVSGATDAANDITFAMTVATQHSSPWNLKYDATILGGYAEGGSSSGMITVTRL
jgi:hypothetical protein